jgi:hypothetical protein
MISQQSMAQQPCDLLMSSIPSVTLPSYNLVSILNASIMSPLIRLNFKVGIFSCLSLSSLKFFIWGNILVALLNENKQDGENKYIMRKYEGGITTLENVDSEKEIGVTIDQHLNLEKKHLIV